MDIELKGEINGIQAAEKILSLDLAVIYSTGDTSNSTFKEAIKNPSSAFLRKPIDPDTLKSVIELSIQRTKIESEKVNLARGISNDEVPESIDEESLNEENQIKIKAKKEYESLKELKHNKFDIVKLESDLKKAHIYIVEDEYTIALDLKLRLEDMGCVVCGISGKGEEAVVKIKETNPDLVLLDIGLEGKIDGITVAHNLEEYNIPIVYIAGLSDENTHYEALKTAPYGFIIKPFNDIDLKNTIFVTLRKRTENIKNIEFVENKVQEKNTELKIEKSNVIIILLGSSALIIAGLVYKNVTWLQWILFIPSAIMVFLAIVSLKKQDPVKEWEVPPFVSMLVPAHNEEYTIEDTVKSLANVDYTLNGKKNFELIVCNDGSQDKTGEILSKLKLEFPHLRIITRVPPRSGKGKGFVLNDGLEISNGDVIAVFDADARVDSDFLNIIIPYLNDPDVQGVQSRIKMFNKDENYLTKMQHVELAGFGNTVRAKDILGKAGFLGGNGQLVKKEAIYNSGGWDGFAITEDLNLSVKLMIEGYAIRYCGETCVYQEAVPTWKQLFRQRTRWSIGNFETLFIYLTKILGSPMPVFRMFGVIEHVAFYGLNMLVFFGFIVFGVNLISWFLLGNVTLIRMDAPLIIGIISAFGFFPGAFITLTRDHISPIRTIIEVFGYWIYSFHLIPLFFLTLYKMLVRKERTWAKTVHTGNKSEEADNQNENLPVGTLKK